MRAVDYVTNGFGIDPRAIRVAPYVPSTPITGPRPFTDIGYLFSPSGGSLFQSGGQVVSFDEGYTNLVSYLSREGMINPMFISIVRGPSGRSYLQQALRFLQIFSANLKRYRGNFSAAYNNAVAMTGTGPLVPNISIAKNMTRRLDDIIKFHTGVLSDL